MLEIKGVDAELAKLRAAADKYQLTVTQAYKNLVHTILVDIVAHTPQYSGNLASNWRVEVGVDFMGHSPTRKHPDYQDPRNWKPSTKGEYFQAGDAPATNIAEEANEFAIARIRWNSRVRFVNNVSYSAEVEAGLGPKIPGTKQKGNKRLNERRSIRSVNLFSGPNVPAHGVAMVAYATMKYGNLKYRNFGYQGLLK